MPTHASEKTLFILVIVEKDGKKYHAYTPGLKGLHVDGKTIDKTLSNTIKAIGVYLDSLHRKGEPIPLGPYLQADYIRVDREVVPDVSMMAFLPSIPCPSHHISGAN